MSTTLAYLCPECGSICAHDDWERSTTVTCFSCAREWEFAPWSYQELIGAIGLEALYQRAVHNFHQQKQIAPGREAWVKDPGWEALEPAMSVLALQAGVRFSTQAVIDEMVRAGQAQAMRAQLRHRRN